LPIVLSRQDYAGPAAPAYIPSYCGGTNASMLSMALAFLIAAIIAAVFGFADTGTGTGVLNAGQVTFYLFLALFLFSFVAELRRTS
jgi:uncharacterized membrane protein YtjA (UPF0391 family)